MANTPPNQEELVKQALQENYWKELLQLLQKEANAAPNRADAAKLYLEMGKIYFHELEDSNAARTVLLKGLEFGEQDPSLLQACENLAVKTHDAALFERICIIHDSPANGSTNGGSTTALRFGRTWLETFRDRKKAAQHLQRAHKLAPNDPEPLRLTAQILEGERRWTDLADIYRKLLSMGDEKLQNALRTKLFFLQFYRMDQPEEALATILPMASGKEDNPHAMLLLNRALMRLKRWRDLANNLGQLAKTSKDPNLVKGYLLQRAEILHLKCGEIDAAVQDLRTVLQADPNNRNALERLINIYRAESQHGKLVAALQQLLDLEIREKNQDEIVTLAVDVARLWEQQLDNDAKAVEALEQAIAQAPRALPLISALSRLYRDKQRWQDLRNIYEAELACTEDANQILSIHYRIAELLEGPLQDLEGAIVLYRKAMQLSANYLPVNQRLIRIYTEHGRWPELIELLESELQSVDNDQRAVTLLHKIGSIYDDKLNDKPAAAEAYRRILERDSANVAAVGALARLHYRSQEWEKLVEMNMREAQLCGEPNQAISLYYNSGLVCEERLHNVDMATMCYQNALSISPTYIPALRSLGNIYSSRENWGGLVAMYHREAQVTSDQNKQLFLLTRIASIFRDKLRDDKSAEKVLGEVLERNPNYMPAVSMLENLFTEQARHEELAALYQRIADHAQIDKENVGHVSLKLAKLLHLELDRPEASESYYLKAIDHGFGVNTCIAALDHIYSQSSRFKELASLLIEVLRKIQEPSYLFNVLYRLGIIQMEYLDAVDDGLENLLQAYKLNPDDLPLLWDLTRLLEDRRHWQKLGEIYQEQSVRPTNTANRLPLMRQALGYYQNDGSHKKCAELGEQLLQGAEEDLQTIEFLVGTYRKLGDHEKLALTMRKFIALQKDREQRISMSQELAVVYDEKLGQTEKALGVLEKLVEEIPEYSYQTLASLEKMLLKQKLWQKLTTLYPRFLGGIHDAELIVKYQLRYGEAFENLKQFDEALEVYRKTLPHDRKNPLVRSRIKLLLRQLKQWQEMTALLEEDAMLDPKAVEPFWEIGDICENYLQAPDRAVEAFHHALERDPAHLRSFESLTRIHLSRSEWQPYLEISDRELEHQKNNERIVSLRLERGRILRDKLQSAAAAVVEFEFGLHADNRNQTVYLELGKTHEALKQWQEAIKIYDKMLATRAITPQHSPEEKLEAANLYHRLGEISMNGLNAEQGCIDYNEKALALAPQFQPSLERLTAIYRKREDWKSLVGIYQRSIDVLRAQEPTKALPLHVNLAEIYEQHLKQEMQAIQEFQRGLQLDKNYRPAHLGLSRVYSKNKQFYPQAIAEFIFLLGNGEPEAPHFQQIARIFEEQSKFDHLCRVYEAMDFLQLLDSGDREIYKTYAGRIPQNFSGTIDKSVSQRFLLHPLEQQPLVEIYNEVFSELVEFGTHTRDSLGLAKKDRIQAKDAHPVRAVANRFCSAFQLPEIDLYLKQGMGTHSALILNDGAALALDTQWAKSWNKFQLAFVIGSELSQLINNRALASQLQAYGFERLMRLVLLPFLKDVPPMTPEIEADIKTIKKLLSRKSRKWIEENGEKCALKLEKTNFTDWIRGIRLTSMRAGLLFSNKLDESVHALNATLKDQATKKPWESEITRELILYTLSDECGTLRKALGTSIYSV